MTKIVEKINYFSRLGTKLNNITIKDLRSIQDEFLDIFIGPTPPKKASIAELKEFGKSIISPKEKAQQIKELLGDLFYVDLPEDYLWAECVRLIKKEVVFHLTDQEELKKQANEIYKQGKIRYYNELSIYKRNIMTGLLPYEAFRILKETATISDGNKEFYGGKLEYIPHYMKLEGPVCWDFGLKELYVKELTRELKNEKIEARLNQYRFLYFSIDEIVKYYRELIDFYKTNLLEIKRISFNGQKKIIDSNLSILYADPNKLSEEQKMIAGHLEFHEERENQAYFAYVDCKLHYDLAIWILTESKKIIKRERKMKL